MKRQKIVMMLGAFLFLMLIPHKIIASEFNFAVVPEIPENQLDKNKTYFDLKMNPGAEQELIVKLRNDTAKDIVVETIISSATTNSNGVVEYGPNATKPDKTLAFNMADIATTEPETTVPAGQEISVKVRVTMPEEPMSGVVAGGITFKEKEDETASSKADEEETGMAIKNKYSYVLALLVRQNEEEIAPDLLLNEVGAAQSNARNIIQANLQNPVATYLNQLKVTAEIRKKNSDKVLYSSETESMQMAPNSNFNYYVPLNGKPLEAGDYLIKIVAFGDKAEGGSYESKNAAGEKVQFNHRWEFEKEFTITSTEAKKLNEADVSIVKDYTWLYILIGVLLLLIVVGLILFLVKRKKKKEEEKAEKAKKKRKKSRK
ncbi:DUF916 and DUF3324 domain-containing protein [Vagococcus sp. BWB3-3]|uniref:DUF916 and DUF3324 domain-containing protein n=1 Tax=Vagococcus allomyrinae TaxID=2794353 RepID=A0A940SQD9_9ENTE|nr:DUF916 and DUF3324 domain-containing protein [Vagococcus allomyrinae]MBP1039612.1 DUF916 and DUF3324 domain-containing protein [Vagococcus allomyrinae]